MVLYVCIQSYSLQQLTTGYDEGLFAYYGATILKWQGNKDIVKFDSKLPITALNMLPRAVEQLFHPGLTKPDASIDIMRGRYVSLLAAVLLALLVYNWSAELYGQPAALLSLLVFLLCPNFLAHGVFVSADIFACLFMTGSFYFLWKFGNSGQMLHFFLASLSVAVAQLSKFSMVHLFILFPVIVTIAFLTGNRQLRMGRLVKLLFIFTGVNWLVICAGHLFYGMFIPLNNYQFQSSAFQQLQKIAHGAGGWLLVPFPSPYIKSMDVVMYFDKLGGGMPGSLNGPTYLLGTSSVHGFWYYYFVVLLYKLPLPVLLLLTACTVLYLVRRSSRVFWKNEMYLIIPAIYFLIYLNFFYSTQVGVRHIMIILPLLYIFIGYFFKQLNTGVSRYIFYALITWQLISVAAYFPHFLPYTNELITDKKLAYTKLADTNICYGEGGRFLQQYLRQHPEAQYLPTAVRSGKIVMEINEMLNLNIATMHKYDWVKRLVPSDHIHSQYLIFDVSAARADSLQKAHF